MFFHGGLSRYVAVLAFGIFVWNHHLVQSLNVKPVQPTITTTFNATVELQWQVTLEPSETILSLLVRKLPGGIIILSGTDKGLNVDQTGRKLFGDRVSGIYNKSSNIVTLTLRNILHNETLTFQVIVFLSTFGTKAANISIVEISGSPRFCGPKVESNYSVIEGSILTIFQDICGNPKPDVKWKVGEDIFRSSSSSSVINNATRQYNYTFATGPLNRNDCGRNITVFASNTLGNIEKNTMIHVEFNPSLAPGISLYRYNTSCINVIWNRENTGNCVIHYHLQFNNNGDIYNTSNKYFIFCSPLQVYTVVLWSSYKGKMGEKVASIFGTTTSTPDITSTLSILTTNSKKLVMTSDNNQCTNNVIVAIVVAVTTTLLLVTIPLAILKRKGLVTVNIRRKNQLKTDEKDNIDDYEVAGTTLSNYADLNVQAIKPSLYTDLTTAARSSEHYAEIELKETQKNTYANIKT